MKAEDVTVAEYLAYHIDRSKKTREEITAALGYKNLSIISMIENGMLALHIDKIGDLAKVLDIDPLYLFRLTIYEYYPDTAKALEGYLYGLKLTKEEMECLRQFRHLSEGNQYKQLKGLIFE